ncbi:MAG: carbonic anhydrase [Desulfuromonas sp.]|nr:carbonic anhydrase [Desulfuromonas sp.]
MTVKKILLSIALIALASTTWANVQESAHTPSHEKEITALSGKPTPDQTIQLLKQGNKRFVKGETIHPNSNSARLIQAGQENQGDYAYATVITCSDSRVPVELIFDAGIMDIFVIRVAGNVIDVDEAGSIEYGLAHVNTPVLVVLGHTQCGAVTAVATALSGHGHPLERNIPALVDNIEPAVKKVLAQHPGATLQDTISLSVEENIWQGIDDLFMTSPATRELVNSGKVKVVGAIYDVGTGKINWLPEQKTFDILHSVEQNPHRALEAMAN